MKVIRVIERQSLFDIAIQEGGLLEAVMDLAPLNGISITDILDVGQELIIDEVRDRDVYDYFANRSLKIEADVDGDSEVNLEGVEFWGIEIDFVVS